MTDEEILDRLDQIDRRLERLERMAYVSFDDIRRVAEYAYLLAIRPPEGPGDRPVRRMSHMRPLSEAEGARGGLTIRHRLVIKSIWKTLGFGIRHDAAAIGKEIAERIMVKAGEEVPATTDADTSRPKTPAGA